MDNKSPKDRNLFHKNMYDVVKYRTLFENKTPDDMQAERVERRLAKMQAEKYRAEYEKKQAELSKDSEMTMGQIIFKFAIIFFVIIGFMSIISAIASAGEEKNKTYTVRTTTTRNYGAAYTTRRTYTTTSRTTRNTATSKKTTTHKKTTTRKDKYNVYDYNDPEDFYEDNYDDFWDYEDAEDYYRQKHKS
ncbi:MAG: hypothetical protein IJ172_04005 [Ruminococcus sp.]|nr:hypothetical protein [Ruminococcus sp.]